VYSRVHIVRLIAMKPITLYFWGHVLSSNDIESVKNIPQKVIVHVANKKKIAANEHKIFEVPQNCNFYTMYLCVIIA
jgi:hypothetical protein